MPNWLRNLTMLAVLVVWLVTVLTTLSNGQLPDALLWGVPGAAWLVLYPSSRKPPPPAKKARPRRKP